MVNLIMIKLINLLGQNKIEIFLPNLKDLIIMNDIKSLILSKYFNFINEYLFVFQLSANTCK